MKKPVFPGIAASNLLVVDIQEKLVPAMAEVDRDQLLKQAGNLIRGFRRFGGSVLYSEQYPAGLGATVPELLELVDPSERLEKTTFSVTGAPEFAGFASLSRDLVVCGIEAHVCVLLMTVLDLLEAGHEVWVPFDAVASRVPSYKENALQLMASAGATIINTESLLFAELRGAKNPAFKEISRLIR